jgi:hypothetical protein
MGLIGSIWNDKRAVRLVGDAGRSGRLRVLSMLIFQIAGGIFALLFIAAAMTGIEGAEHR